MRFDRMLDIVGPFIVSNTRARAARRREMFRVPAPEGRVVFLGDSITEGGLWDELFPDLSTLNRGIGGDTTIDLLERIDDAINEPRVVSLLIGTNDLHGRRSHRGLDGIAMRCKELIDRIQVRAASAPVLLNSVMPRATLYATRVQALNNRYRQVAADTGAVFVDVWPVLADSEDELRAEYTRDHIHLTTAGYHAWAEILKPHLDLAMT